ncbi:MAG TPA: ABC transporter ATP-binding protein [Clostridiales bacterium]|nr:ABC transporter ATP-binding protein [Clostridiales bacterium]
MPFFRAAQHLFYGRVFVDTVTNVSARGEIAIELRGITKAFGSVIANNNIDLIIRRGEILALLGENGSGKTTLMNMLSGIYHPDSGRIYVNGNEVFIRSPQDATRLGIGMIHQHFKLVDVLTAADNIILGAGKGFLLRRNRFEEARKVAERYGMYIDPEKKIYEMSVSEKQTVEILKVLYRGANILILDEPTAVLTPQETQRLFEILRRMRDDGCAIVIITHKLNEVLEISDRVTILRRGESVATVKTSETNAAKLTEYMVGRPVTLKIERPDTKPTERLLNVYHLTVEDEDGVTRLDDVSFSLRGGEILGVAGVAGSGQKELCETIAGLHPIKKGAILYKKENIEGKTPREIIKLGISMSFIPEDRLGMGLAASLDIADNMMLKSYRDPKSPFTPRKAAEEMAKEVIKKLDIVTSGINQPVRMLSGGNVQKVLLGREIHVNPSVLITAYPVRGLDIGSSYVIYDALNEQKKRGVGVLYIGEDLDVMLELCDRIMVLCHGKVTGILNARTATKEQIGLLMAGATTNERYGEEVVPNE